MWMMVAEFKKGITMSCDREMLKIFMKTPASWSAHTWSA